MDIFDNEIELFNGNVLGDIRDSDLNQERKELIHKIDGILSDNLPKTCVAFVGVTKGRKPLDIMILINYFYHILEYCLHLLEAIYSNSPNRELLKVFDTELRLIECKSCFTPQECKTPYSKELRGLFRMINLNRKDIDIFFWKHEDALRQRLGDKRVDAFIKYFENEEWHGDWAILDIRSFAVQVEVRHVSDLVCSQTGKVSRTLTITDARNVFMVLLMLLFGNTMKSFAFLYIAPFKTMDGLVNEFGMGFPSTEDELSVSEARKSEMQKLSRWQLEIS